jgi:hypothetical protein
VSQELATGESSSSDGIMATPMFGSYFSACLEFPIATVSHSMVIPSLMSVRGREDSEWRKERNAAYLDRQAHETGTFNADFISG